MRAAPWTRGSGLAFLVVLRLVAACGTTDDAEPVTTVAERQDHCGNDRCQPGKDEDCSTCPDDCGTCPQPPRSCGNGRCQPGKGEDCTTCALDCGTCPQPPRSCGNDRCQPGKGEDCNTCAADCGVCPPPPPACGDGTCNAAETCTTCAEDCGMCPPPPPACGDGACDGEEDCTTCATDCGACPPPPPSCGDGACAGEEDCTTCATDCGACPPPPSSDLRVYRVLPPDVTPMRARSIAAAIGFDGDVVETADSVQVVRSPVAPVGPLVLHGTGGFVTLGRFFGWVSTGAPVFSGAIADDGTLTGTVALPAMTATVGTRTITAIADATAPIHGRIAPRDGRVELTFAPRLTLTCAGTGCFTGACTIDAAAVTVTSLTSGGGSYDPATGEAVLAAEGSLPAVSSCATADPAAVNALLSLPSSSGFYDLGVDADPVITARRPQVLTLTRASGAVRFADLDALAQYAADDLPSDPAALAVAAAVLAQAGLLPPDAELEVTRDENLDTDGAPSEFAVRVTAEPRLAISDDAVTGAPILVPVESAHVSISLGAGGRVVGLHSEWRPAVLDRTVPRVPEAEALLELAAELGDPAGFELGLVYFGFGERERQGFYDPMYTLGVAGAHGTIAVSATPATHFTPRLAALAPEPEVAIHGTDGIALSATITDGTPPYTITWRTVDGAVLGTGASISTQLGAGDHDLTVDVRDANGAGWEQSYRLPVTGAGGPGGNPNPGPFPPPPPPPTPAPVTGTTAVVATTGVSLDVDVRPAGVPGSTRAGPLVSNVGYGNDLFVEKLYFDQWRYEVRIQGPDGRYWLRSDRCSDGEIGAGGGSAAEVCKNPKGPFATTLQRTPAVTNTGGTITSSIQIDNVPGTVTLAFDYAPRTAYCGPQPGPVDRAATAFVYRAIRRKVGGQCPGFSPAMSWTYAPPENVSCLDVKQWCDSYAGRSNDDGAPYCDVPASLYGDCDQALPPTFYVVEFNAWMYSALIPHAPGVAQRVTLVKDSDSQFRLADTDGTMGIGPSVLPGNSFAVIHAMRTERVASMATPTGRGAWDNLHMKLDRKHDVFFPGGNDPTDLADNEPTLHLHESWFEGPTDSKGQTVDWLLMRDKADEREPDLRPDLGVDGEALWTQRTPFEGFGRDTLMFHKSFAQSHVCERNGAVDNTGKPCRVFPSTFFFTH